MECPDREDAEPRAPLADADTLPVPGQPAGGPEPAVDVTNAVIERAFAVVWSLLLGTPGFPADLPRSA